MQKAKKQFGEIATLLTIGAVVIIAISTVFSTLFLKNSNNKIAVNPRARVIDDDTINYADINAAIQDQVNQSSTNNTIPEARTRDDTVQPDQSSQQQPDKPASVYESQNQNDTSQDQSSQDQSWQQSFTTFCQNNPGACGSTTQNSNQDNTQTNPPPANQQYQYAVATPTPIPQWVLPWDQGWRWAWENQVTPAPVSQTDVQPIPAPETNTTQNTNPLLNGAQDWLTQQQQNWNTVTTLWNESPVNPVNIGDTINKFKEESSQWINNEPQPTQQNTQQNQNLGNTIVDTVQQGQDWLSQRQNEWTNGVSEFFNQNLQPTPVSETSAPSNNVSNPFQPVGDFFKNNNIGQGSPEQFIQDEWNKRVQYFQEVPLLKAEGQFIQDEWNRGIQRFQGLLPTSSPVEITATQKPQENGINPLAGTGSIIGGFLGQFFNNIPLVSPTLLSGQKIQTIVLPSPKVTESQLGAPAAAPTPQGGDPCKGGDPFGQGPSDVPRCALQILGQQLGQKFQQVIGITPQPTPTPKPGQLPGWVPCIQGHGNCPTPTPVPVTPTPVSGTPPPSPTPKSGFQLPSLCVQGFGFNCPTPTPTGPTPTSVPNLTSTPVITAPVRLPTSRPPCNQFEWRNPITNDCDARDAESKKPTPTPIPPIPTPTTIPFFPIPQPTCTLGDKLVPLNNCDDRDLLAKRYEDVKKVDPQVLYPTMVAISEKCKDPDYKKANQAQCNFTLPPPPPTSTPVPPTPVLPTSVPTPTPKSGFQLPSLCVQGFGFNCPTPTPAGPTPTPGGPTPTPAPGGSNQLQGIGDFFQNGGDIIHNINTWKDYALQGVGDIIHNANTWKDYMLFGIGDAIYNTNTWKDHFGRAIDKARTGDITPTQVPSAGTLTPGAGTPTPTIATSTTTTAGVTPTPKGPPSAYDLALAKPVPPVRDWGPLQYQPDQLKCDGGGCDKCGYGGSEGAGCSKFCQDPKNNCRYWDRANDRPAFDGPYTACGDSRLKCDANIGGCGNDGCYHQTEGKAQPPTSTPKAGAPGAATPTPNPTTNPQVLPFTPRSCDAWELKMNSEECKKTGYIMRRPCELASLDWLQTMQCSSGGLIVSVAIPAVVEPTKTPVSTGVGASTYVPRPCDGWERQANREECDKTGYIMRKPCELASLDWLQTLQCATGGLIVSVKVN